jgi:hypothetical protein
MNAQLTWSKVDSCRKQAFTLIENSRILDSDSAWRDTTIHTGPGDDPQGPSFGTPVHFPKIVPRIVPSRGLLPFRWRRHMGLEWGANTEKSNRVQVPLNH